MNLRVDENKIMFAYLVQKIRHVSDCVNYEARTNRKLAPFSPDIAPYTQQIVDLIDNVFHESQLPDMQDERKQKINPLNYRFEKRKFKALWRNINQTAIYRVNSSLRNLSKTTLTLSIKIYKLHQFHTPSKLEF